VLQDARKILIFDTSSLNKLTNESDCKSLIKSLGIGYRVRLTETNLSELSATSDADDRDGFLSVCRHLVYAGECIRPYNWIIEELVKMHSRSPQRFDWRTLNVHGPELEDQLTRPNILGSDELAEGTLAEFEMRAEEFEMIFNNARPGFERIFEDKAAKRPDAGKLVDILMSETGAYQKLAMGMYKRGCGVEIDEASVREFVAACPPFRAALVSLCIAQYYRCIRDKRGAGTYKAGRLDLFMAVYVPYCDIFVTRDTGHYNSLSLVGVNASPPTRVLTYQEFGQKMLLLV